MRYLVAVQAGIVENAIPVGESFQTGDITAGESVRRSDIPKSKGKYMRKTINECNKNFLKSVSCVGFKVVN